MSPILGQVSSWTPFRIGSDAAGPRREADIYFFMSGPGRCSTPTLDTLTAQGDSRSREGRESEETHRRGRCWKLRRAERTPQAHPELAVPGRSPPFLKHHHTLGGWARPSLSTIQPPPGRRENKFYVYIARVPPWYSVLETPTLVQKERQAPASRPWGHDS